MTFAPGGSLAVIVATFRHPNEFVRVGRWVRRKNLELLVITDGITCPLIPFAHLALVAPSQHIPFQGSPTSISCMINYLVHEVDSQMGGDLKEHQEEIERTYFENDLLFNPTHQQ